MSRFTLASLFAPWRPAAQAPWHAGWYRTRTEPLTHSWWNQMAYWDGQAWWEYGGFGAGVLRVRRQVPVLQWQGLCCPVPEACERLAANLPRSRGARRRYEAFLAVLREKPATAPAFTPGPAPASYAAPASRGARW